LLCKVVIFGNFQRTGTADADSLPDTDPFMSMVKRANRDPAIKKDVDDSAYAICHDFTQYYKEATSSVKL